MPIEFRCKKCQTLLRTPDDTVGREAICPQCGSRMNVPYVSCPTPRSPYVAPEDYEPAPLPPPPSPGDNAAIASLILGIVSLFFSCCCLIGLPASIVGLVLGIMGLQSRQRPMAIAGIVLCSIGLLASLGFVGIHLATKGGRFQQPIFR